MPNPHEEYIELCALSTAGELTPAEQQRLDAHLADCSECRGVLREFEETVTQIAPALATEAIDNHAAEDDFDPSWSVVEAEARLMRAVEKEPAPKRATSGPKIPPRGVGHLPILAIAAGLLALLPYAGYCVGMRRARESADHLALLEKPVSIKSSHAELAAKPVEQATAAIHLTPDVPERPINIVESSRREIVLLQEQKRELEQQLASRSETIARSEAEREELIRRLDQSQASADELALKVQSTVEQTSKGTAQSQVLAAEVSELHNLLSAKDKEIADERELLAHDRDIRNLMGARDLYIAEIYDVAKSGDTQRPFGRVFYTKDKSLVFYGYDLDRQRGITQTSTFQAWGRHGTDPHRDVSLGILFQDDAQKQRWVLKSDDAATIRQLDAVFVTVEPKGGSAKPTGRPLLFTYLRLSPNHP